jgi:hypothetical protein
MLKIFEYKLVIDPLVEVNVVIVPDGVVIDGIVKAPLELINQEKLELLVFIKPNVLELLFYR